MNRQLSVSINFRIFLFSIFLIVLIQFKGNSQTKNDNSVYCKELAIESAQFSDQAYYYSQLSFFEKKTNFSINYIDTALFSINGAISKIDSSIILASDSAFMALKYAKIALEYHKKAQKTLVFAKNSLNYSDKIELLKRAMAYSENATIDAYHASFYFAGNKKRKKKGESKDSADASMQITKLEIDQVLYRLLKGDVFEKLQFNESEIISLHQKIDLTKDKRQLTKLKEQLKTKEIKEKILIQKDEDIQLKLTTIGTLLEQSILKGKNGINQKDTIFYKNLVKTTDEWNKNFKSESEMPNFLIYQIQLGFFKNSVLIETFNGLRPIYTKVTDNGTCYSIGLFEKISDAREAKKNVNSMGLIDAFIVAYYNKKKITLAEAIKLEKK